MYKKIASANDLSAVQIGDIIIRNSADTNTADTLIDIPKNAHQFQVRSISANKVMELVEPIGSVPLYASAGDVTRLFIKLADLLDEKTWWCLS